MKFRPVLLLAPLWILLLLGPGGARLTTVAAAVTQAAILSARNSLSIDTASATVSIADVPIAGLAAFNDSPTPLGSPTTLSATVTAGSNVIYDWAFGDGLSGSGELVTHTYPAAGVYTAVLTASNSLSVWTASTTVSITDVLTPAVGQGLIPLHFAQI